ncbi:hypothetical protein M199_gp126 [Halogranum tailed virus 1]|uniref:Uncharacterized protein n=1 Tax=Halogranum tailed virus 1 TaxID=1273749 RepID=R4T9E1_9CAUD|nr:hypothetical protein M199_gp126 [Halogranum tailed virus 1]AGM11540.1 hypothetical protein HGTV1_243 [Halogranum tailed virus 1]
MNPAKFLKDFEADTDRDRLVNLVYDEMVAYCRKANISIDDISNDELEQLAEAFVDRGFSRTSEEARKADERFKVDSN